MDWRGHKPMQRWICNLRRASFSIYDASTALDKTTPPKDLAVQFMQAFLKKKLASRLLKLVCVNEIEVKVRVRTVQLKTCDWWPPRLMGVVGTQVRTMKILIHSRGSLPNYAWSQKQERPKFACLTPREGPMSLKWNWSMNARWECAGLWLWFFLKPSQRFVFFLWTLVFGRAQIWTRRVALKKAARAAQY